MWNTDLPGPVPSSDGATGPMEKVTCKTYIFYYSTLECNFEKYCLIEWTQLNIFTMVQNSNELKFFKTELSEPTKSLCKIMAHLTQETLKCSSITVNNSYDVMKILNKLKKKNIVELHINDFKNLYDSIYL